MRVPSHCSYTGGVCLPLVVLCPSYQPVKLSHNSLWPADPTPTQVLKTKTRPLLPTSTTVLLLSYCSTVPHPVPSARAVLQPTLSCPPVLAAPPTANCNLPQPHQFNLLWGIFSDTPGQAGFIYFINIFYCSLQPDQSLPAGRHRHPRHAGDDHQSPGQGGDDCHHPADHVPGLHAVHGPQNAPLYPSTP